MNDFIKQAAIRLKNLKQQSLRLRPTKAHNDYNHEPWAVNKYNPATGAYEPQYGSGEKTANEVMQRALDGLRQRQARRVVPSPHDMAGTSDSTAAESVKMAQRIVCDMPDNLSPDQQHQYFHTVVTNMNKLRAPQLPSAPPMGAPVMPPKTADILPQPHNMISTMSVASDKKHESASLARKLQWHQPHTKIAVAFLKRAHPYPPDADGANMGQFKTFGPEPTPTPRPTPFPSPSPTPHYNPANSAEGFGLPADTNFIKQFQHGGPSATPLPQINAHPSPTPTLAPSPTNSAQGPHILDQFHAAKLGHLQEYKNWSKLTHKSADDQNGHPVLDTIGAGAVGTGLGALGGGAMARANITTRSQNAYFLDKLNSHLQMDKLRGLNPKSVSLALEGAPEGFKLPAKFTGKIPAAAIERGWSPFAKTISKARVRGGLIGGGIGLAGMGLSHLFGGAGTQKQASLLEEYIGYLSKRSDVSTAAQKAIKLVSKLPVR